MAGVAVVVRRLGVRPVCPTCGAELQGLRCPWATSTRQVTGPAGTVYCAWPRAPRVPPQYTVSRSRRGPA